MEKAGYHSIMMEETETRYGAVETIEEGEKFARFLAGNRGKVSGYHPGVLPNFGDENGACVGSKDAGVPILVQAYPDEVGKMDFAHRRVMRCAERLPCAMYCGSAESNIPCLNHLPFCILLPMNFRHRSKLLPGYAGS